MVFWFASHEVGGKVTIIAPVFGISWVRANCESDPAMLQKLSIHMESCFYCILLWLTDLYAGILPIYYSRCSCSLLSSPGTVTGSYREPPKQFLYIRLQDR